MKIIEMFYNINGEGDEMGRKTVFVRTAGCSIRCPGCDTGYSWVVANADSMNAYAIWKAVSKYPCAHVTITGGEPFEQKDLADVIEFLVKKGYDITIETSGKYFDKHLSKIAKVVVSPKFHIMSDEYLDNLAQWRWADATFKFVAKPNKDSVNEVVELFDKLHLHKAYVQPWEPETCTSIQDRKKLFLDTLKIVKEYTGERDIRLTPQFHKFLKGRQKGF